VCYAFAIQAVWRLHTCSMTTPISSPKTPPPLKLDRVSGGVYPRSPNVSVNKNVEWINSRGAWTFYIALILLNWMVLSTVMNPGESKLSHLHFSVLTIGACKAQRYTGGGLMQDLRCCAGTLVSLRTFVCYRLSMDICSLDPWRLDLLSPTLAQGLPH